MTTGERITALRKGRGMTQEQLAERLSVTRQSVSKWELDQATPEMACAVGLSELFEVSLDYLIRGTDALPATETVTTPPPVSTQESPITEDARSASKPLTARGYALLFGLSALLAVELCLHLYLLLEWVFGDGAGMAAIPLSFIYTLPLPVLYLATRRWTYPNQRTAMRHLWKLTGVAAVVGNLLYVASYMIFIRYASPHGDHWFWYTAWEAVFYHFPISAALLSAVLIPVAVRCHQKPRLCWPVYGLAAVAYYPLSWYLIEQLWDLLPIHDRFFPVMALLVLGVVALSQYIVYRRLPPAEASERTVSATPLGWRQVTVLVALMTMAVYSLGAGLYVGLALVFGQLSMTVLPMLWLPLPALCVMLLRGKSYATARAALGDAVKVTAIFLPLMLLSHAAAYQTALWLTAFGGPVPSIDWISFLLWSCGFSIGGAILAVPASVLVRKRHWLCLAVCGGLILLYGVAIYFGIDVNALPALA